MASEVLMAEPDSASAEFMDGLTRNGFSIKRVGSIEKLLRISRTRPPQIVIIDTSIPDYDKIRTPEAFRACTHLCNTPLILVSEPFERSTLTEPFAFQVDDCFSRKMNIDDVALRVRAAAARRKVLAGGVQVESAARALPSLCASDDTQDACEVLQKVLSELSRFRQLGRCSATLLEQESRRGYVLASSDAPVSQGWRLDLTNYPELLEVSRTASPVIIPDVHESALMAPVAARISNQNFQSLFVIPALSGERVIGAVVLRFPEKDPQISREELFYCRLMAVLLGQILERTIGATPAPSERGETSARLPRGARQRDDFTFFAINALRAPVTAIHGFCSLIQESGSTNMDQEQREYLEKVIRNCEDMSGMICDLFDLSHFVSGRTRMDIAPRDLCVVLNRVREKIWPEAQRKGVRFQWDLQMNCCWALFDAAGIQRVLVGLLENAVRVTPAGGYVLLTVQVKGTQIEIGVEDDGDCRPEGDASGRRDDRLSCESDPVGDSPGLSIALYRAIIEDHGSPLLIERGSTRGNRYIFTLPRTMTKSF